MIVNTDLVKGNSRSIGMFSRHGKMTGLIHSIFREKKDISSFNPKHNNEDDVFERFLAQDNGANQESSTLEVEKPSGSFYFRSVSREKAQPLRPKTPDVGRYRPKYDLVEPKVVYLPTSKEKLNKTISYDNRGPGCIKDGISCDYKIRQIQKKVNELRSNINKSGVDVEGLYKTNQISKGVYKLFKTPSIKVLNENSKGPVGYQSADTIVTTQDNYDQGFQNSHEIVGKITTYTNLKEELGSLIQKSKENIKKKEGKIVDKPRPSTPIPLPFDLQISRPPIVKPKQYSKTGGFDNDTSFSQTMRQNQNQSLNWSFYQDKLKHTASFENYSKRKTVFPPSDTTLLFYNYDKFKVSLANTNKPTINFGKNPPRPETANPNCSSSEYGDLMKSFYGTKKSGNISLDMRKTTGRKFKWNKESSEKRNMVNKGPPNLYFVTKSANSSFIQASPNTSFIKA